MKMIRYIVLMLYMISAVSCGGGGGEDVSVSQYAGEEPLQASSDGSGSVQIASSASDVVYDIQVTDDSGRPVGEMQVSYMEEDGKAVLLVSDPDGVYADVLMIGTPEELEGRLGRKSRAHSFSLNITMKPKNSNTIGFDSVSSRNLGEVYISDNARASMESETGCYTPLEIIEKFENIFSREHFDGWSILMFEKEVTDDTAANVMYPSYLMENAGYQMYAAFKTRIEYLNGVDSGDMDNEDVGLTCYYPPASIGFDAICSVERGAESCQTAAVPEMNPGDTSANTAPFIVGTPFTSVTAGSFYAFYPAAFDADGDTVIYSIENKPDWADFNTETGELSGTPAESDSGTYSSITISVTDGADTDLLEPFAVTVSVYNFVPFIGGSPGTWVKTGNSYSFTPAGYDADGDLLTYIIENKPSWADFDTGTGTLSGTPSDSDGGTYNNIIISVTDGEDTASLDFFSITVSTENSAPYIGGSPFGSVTSGSSYSFTPAGYDADGDALTYIIENKPSWADFDTGTGTLSGTPSDSDAGTYNNIIISATDGEDTSALDFFSITVSTDNSPPYIGGTPDSSAASGQLYSYTPGAYDADGDTLLFSIENKPDWASFDTASGALTGTPARADAGTYSNIVISVTDGVETASLDSFDITVSIANTSPVISGNPASLIKAGTAYSFVPSSSDDEGNTLIFSIENKPDWADFNMATGEISGTPAVSDSGEYTDITVTVSDGQSSSSLAAFSIVVYPSTVVPNGSLFWQDEATVSTARYTYSSAVNYCSGLSLGGMSDWRLPSIGELGTIYNGGNNPKFISGIQNAASFHLSSTSASFSSSFVMLFDYNSGTTGSQPKTLDGYVRCVR